jgi:hypothetical protein
MLDATRPPTRPQADVPRPGRIRRALRRVTTVLACLFLLLLLVAPNQLGQLAPAALLRIPADGLVAVALVFLLPGRLRRVAVPAAGVLLGLLAILKIVSLGFSAVLDRPFHPVLDWPFLVAGGDYLRQSTGSAAMYGAAAAALLLAAGVLLLVMAAYRRVARLTLRHRTRAAGAVSVLTAAWLACVTAGAQLVPGVPVAAQDLYDRVRQVRTGAQDENVFAAQLSADAYRRTPAEDLLTALRGKDVVVAFVESYGRVALADPELSSQVGAVLDAGTARLRAAGYTSRSAWLTSPTTGGGSWLAQSTLLSGLWIDNQQRYRAMMSSDRFTLPAAFGLAGWRTVAVMPATTTPWPEGAVYGYDKLYTAPDLGYQGPRYSFATMPDQYTLHTFQQRERAPGHLPVMAVIPLISSHSPWEPVPRMLDWNAVGDGSVYDTAAGSGDPAEIVEKRDRGRVRHAYRNRSRTRCTRWSPTWRRTAATTWCWSSSATTSPRRRSPARTPAGTRPSPWSPATRRSWTGSRAGGGRRASSPAPTPRSGAWTPSATASSPRTPPDPASPSLTATLRGVLAAALRAAVSGNLQQ